MAFMEASVRAVVILGKDPLHVISAHSSLTFVFSLGK